MAMMSHNDSRSDIDCSSSVSVTTDGERCVMYFFQLPCTEYTHTYAHTECTTVLVNQGHLLVSQVRKHRLILTLSEEQNREEEDKEREENED